MKKRGLSKSLKILSIASAVVIFSSTTIITSERASAGRFTKFFRNMGRSVRGFFGGRSRTPKGPDISGPTLLSTTKSDIVRLNPNVTLDEFDYTGLKTGKGLGVKPLSRSDGDLTYGNRGMNPNYTPGSSPTSTPGTTRAQIHRSGEEVYDNVNPSTGGPITPVNLTKPRRTSGSDNNLNYADLDWTRQGARPRTGGGPSETVVYAKIQKPTPKPKKTPPPVAPKPKNMNLPFTPKQDPPKKPPRNFSYGNTNTTSAPKTSADGLSMLTKKK